MFYALYHFVIDVWSTPVIKIYNSGDIVSFIIASMLHVFDVLVPHPQKLEI